MLPVLNSVSKAKKKLYTSATELFLDKFIICLCEEDYSVLIKDSEGITEEDIKKAWDSIYFEYKDIIKDREQRNNETLIQEYTLLISRRNIINLCLYRLSEFHSDEIIEELKKWTMVVEKLDPGDPEQYAKDIESIRNRNARIDVDIRHLEMELSKRLPEVVTDKIDKWHFEKVIVQLEKHIGKSIVKETTTTANYAFMLVDLIMKSEELNRQLSNI